MMLNNFHVSSLLAICVSSLERGLFRYLCPLLIRLSFYYRVVRVFDLSYGQASCKYDWQIFSPILWVVCSL